MNGPPIVTMEACQCLVCYKQTARQRTAFHSWLKCYCIYMIEKLIIRNSLWTLRTNYCFDIALTWAFTTLIDCISIQTNSTLCSTQQANPSRVGYREKEYTVGKIVNSDFHSHIFFPCFLSSLRLFIQWPRVKVTKTVAGLPVRRRRRSALRDRPVEQRQSQTRNQTRR